MSLAQAFQTFIAPARRLADPYRPSLHFTAKKNWINDPNGLVFYDGEYHLFFQHNPFGKSWGHMSWGHAVSTDLVHWEELPVAIPEQEFMIFSGCCVVDWQNLSGLGDGRKPPLLAFFTGFDPQTEIQNQRLAYSHDRGRTWTHFSDGPILDLGSKDFRDPNVFYHAPSRAWVMVVALAKEHKVQIYRSQNLTSWTLSSEFGPAGATTGQWECPELVCVPLEDGSSAHWVMKVDVDNGLVAAGSGAQYFVGDFDGERFVPTDVDGHIADYGPDFYAAVTWSDLPETHKHPVWIGWMSNHASGHHYPTDPWRGAMTLPRELFLFEEEGALRLGQRPVQAVFAALGSPIGRRAQLVKPGRNFSLYSRTRSSVARLEVEVLPKSKGSNRQILISSNGRPAVSISIDQALKHLTLERKQLGEIFHRKYAGSSTCPLPSVKGALVLDVIIDGATIEVFIAGGRRVLSACAFGEECPLDGVRLVGRGIHGRLTVSRV